jgi:antirestriction protein ArdC
MKIKSTDLELYKTIIRAKPDTPNYLTVNKRITRRNQKNKFCNKQIKDLIKTIGVEIRQGTLDVAAYYDSGGYVVMPYQKNCKVIGDVSREENYYAKLLHEVTHWAGRHWRAKRACAKVSNYNSTTKLDSYLEEMIAELGAFLFIKHFGYRKNISEPSAKYVNYHLQEIPARKRKEYFAKAMREARRSFNFIMKKYKEHGEEEKSISEIYQQLKLI